MFNDLYGKDKLFLFFSIAAVALALYTAYATYDYLSFKRWHQWGVEYAAPAGADKGGLQSNKEALLEVWAKGHGKALSPENKQSVAAEAEQSLQTVYTEKNYKEKLQIIQYAPGFFILALLGVVCGFARRRKRSPILDI